MSSKRTSSGVTNEPDPINHDTIVSIDLPPPPPPLPPPPPPPPAPPKPNLPCRDLIEGSREDYVKFGVPLYEASIKGDWKAANAILKEKPELRTYAITENYETLLHIVAASSKSTKSMEEFVGNLVISMDEEELTLQDKYYNTALSLAAAAGNVEIARILVAKNKDLVEIPGSDRIMPLYRAALFAKPKMVRYLYNVSGRMRSKFWTNENRGWVLLKCVEADLFDVALTIVRHHTKVTTQKRLLSDILLLLAQNTRACGGIKPHIFLRINKSIFHEKIGHGEKECDALQLLRTIIIMVQGSRADDPSCLYTNEEHSW